MGPLWQVVLGRPITRLIQPEDSLGPGRPEVAPPVGGTGGFLGKEQIGSSDPPLQGAWGLMAAKLVLWGVAVSGLVVLIPLNWGESFGPSASSPHQAPESPRPMLCWEQKPHRPPPAPGPPSPNQPRAPEQPDGAEGVLGGSANSHSKGLNQPASALGADSAWPMEQLELTSGQRLFGLIESVDEQWVYFVQVKREPGRPARLLVRPIQRSEVVRMERLPEPERQQLQERVTSLAFHARIESARMEALGLEKRIQNNIPVFSYVSRWFHLESTLPEQMTRRAIVRLEQIFSGYRRLLPPRTEPQRCLKIVIFSSRMEYEEALGRYGIRLANPAVFLPKENLVLTGADLGQFAAQLKQLEEEHARLRQELSRLRSQLAKKLQELGRKLRQQGVPREEAAKILQRERAAFDNQINQKLAEIQRVDRKNAELFAKLMEQTLRQLYHEAFHAYMENYLFPSSQYQTPLWLQEGLAMLFQEGLVEADTLRIDSPSPEAVKLIRQDQRQGVSLPLRDLLAAGKTEFLQTPTSGSAWANRYYAYAWAVVYYLCQTERLSPAGLEAYVGTEAHHLPPLERFRRLIDMDVHQWEEGWQKFLRSL